MELHSMICGDLNGKEIKKKKNGYMYVYNWLTLFYSRKSHNIVKQLYFNIFSRKSLIQWKF